MAAALTTCPSSWGEQTQPTRAHLTHLLCSPAAPQAAQLWELELFGDGGVQPHPSAFSLPEELLLLPRHPTQSLSLTQGRTNPLCGLLQERLAGSGPLHEKRASRAAVSTVVGLTNVIILRVFMSKSILMALYYTAACSLAL